MLSQFRLRRTDVRTLAIVVLAIWLVGWVGPAEAGYEVSARAEHTCAVDDAGFSIQCWGANRHGQTDVPAFSWSPFAVYEMNGDGMAC
jgi:hypothetical protein|tara:strand:- start:116 stop:379 length:264 start_codon:yes stop_codon:yes gene_type:complete